MKEVERLEPQEVEVHKKKSFLEQLEETYKDDFLPKDWSDKQKEKVLKMTDKDNTKKMIISAIPMDCKGHRCQFASTCELQQNNEAPVSSKCPYEFALMRHFMADFIDQLGVDLDNTVEVCQVRDMVNQEVQMLRANKLLAQESFIQENAVGIDSDGDPIFRKELHLAVDLEDRLHKRRQNFFKQFLATREARSKAGVAAIDSAQGLADLMNTFKTMENQQQELLKKQLGIIDTDDYVEAKKRELDQG